MLMSIPLLPADRIEEGFRAIISFAKQKRLFKRLEKLFNYFERYWINNQVIYFQLYCLADRPSARPPARETIRQTLFNPQNKRNTISVKDLNMRTTSSMEGLNSNIQRDFSKKTDIFKFTDALKLFESERSSDLHTLSLDKSSQFQRRHPKDRIRDEKIKMNTELLDDGSITVLDFLKSMATAEMMPKDGIQHILVY